MCAHLPALQRFATARGARVDCVSVLRDNGVWAAEDYRLHLRVPAHGAAVDVRELRPAARPSLSRGETRTGDSRFGSDTGSDTVLSSPARGIVTHWSPRDERWLAAAAPASVSMMEALRQSMRCLEPDDVVAAIESAVYRKRITAAQADVLAESAPRRLRATVREIELGAQSGVETLVRLGFRRLGFRVTPQAFVPGVGHVDNLIEDCVAVESDGRRFHENNLETDYDRDLASEYLGVRVLRVSPRIVLKRWPWLVETVTRMVIAAQPRRR